MAKTYKEPNKCETETTINVLYGEKILSIYKIKRSISGSSWNISLEDKIKIQKLIVKANIYDL